MACKNFEFQETVKCVFHLMSRAMSSFLPYKDAKCDKWDWLKSLLNRFNKKWHHFVVESQITRYYIRCIAIDTSSITLVLQKINVPVCVCLFQHLGVSVCLFQLLGVMVFLHTFLTLVLYFIFSTRSQFNLCILIFKPKRIQKSVWKLFHFDIDSYFVKGKLGSEDKFKFKIATFESSICQ